MPIVVPLSMFKQENMKANYICKYFRVNAKSKRLLVPEIDHSIHHCIVDKLYALFVLTDSLNH